MNYIILLIALTFNVTPVFGQTVLIKEYKEQSSFCGTNLKLYSDSTYFLIYGCEGNQMINYGDFYYKNDQLILKSISKEKFNPIISVTYIDTLFNSNVEIISISKENDTSHLNSFLTNKKTADIWLNTPDFSIEFKNEIKINKVVTDYNNEYKSYRVNNDSIAVCLKDIFYLKNEKLVFHIPPNFNKLVIALNLPSLVCNTMFVVHYSYFDIDFDQIEINGEKIKVQH
jgi:hypothetical protein